MPLPMQLGAGLWGVTRASDDRVERGRAGSDVIGEERGVGPGPGGWARARQTG
jgi:hypothetical protein